VSVRILIIDPSPEVGQQMLIRLQLAGYEVAVEQEVEVVIEAAERFEPDLLFIDADLGPINGYQLCQLIKRHLPSARVVVTSWDRSAQARFWAESSDADGFLAKPYTPNQLVDIAKIVEKD